MKQFIWFHPLYIQESAEKKIKGQIENAKKHGYIVLNEEGLNSVTTNDHLTIVGHTNSPKGSSAEEDSDDEQEDTGLYIQGETAEQCVESLQKAGLKNAPQLLSLECCKAAVKGGIAISLSSHPFLNTTIIEANTSGVGRSPGGNVRWSMPEDYFGRVVMKETDNPWIFLLSGKEVAKHPHKTYQIKDVMESILQSNQQEELREEKIQSPGKIG